MPLFSDNAIQQVWETAKIVEGYNPNIWRQDFAGAWIRRDHYGMRNAFGWEIDHKVPRALGGTSELGNLWPLHWRNNIEKGDSYPEFTTCLSSDGNKNIEKEQSWRWNTPRQ